MVAGGGDINCDSDGSNVSDNGDVIDDGGGDSSVSGHGGGNQLRR